MLQSNIRSYNVNKSIFYPPTLSNVINSHYTQAIYILQHPNYIDRLPYCYLVKLSSYLGVGYDEVIELFRQYYIDNNIKPKNRSYKKKAIKKKGN